MAKPICGDDVPAKAINAAVRYFVGLLIEKVSELNHRARDQSLKVLLELFRNPLVDIRILIEGIMDFIEKGGKPEKE